MSDLNHIVTQPDTGNVIGRTSQLLSHFFVKATRRHWLKWVVAFVLMPWHMASAQVITDGYNRLGTWTPSIVGTAYGPYNGSTALSYSWGWKLSAWQTTPTDANGATCSIAGLPYTTVDGWSGYQIQPGVLIILTGSLSATAKTGTPSATTNVITDIYSATWDSKGAIAANWLTPGSPSHCAAIQRQITGNFYILDGATTSMNVTYGVYVSPSAAVGALPTTYLQLHKTSGANKQSALSFSNLTIARTECSMNTANLVPFGDVTPAQATDGKGIAVQSSLSVSCTNEGGATSAITYSVTPKTQAGGQYTLPLLSTVGGSIAGDIRGFIGANATSDAGCTDKASSLRMDNTKVALRSVTSTESWFDPLVWVLCPRDTAEPGPATATATLEVNW
ncbi:hypothetical protein OP862_17670 [Yersinia massiliensis]|uniref:Adhesin n=1 Tax=Yersinia massiliensis TaxID=419257 RepID=A0AA91BAS2_9GAMM|nr:MULTISPECIES: hypothetical protein [Yersinia]MDA5546947.1 hypothetical protein [Yersinia massiliensis]NIL26620.1 hypothetical protein [Yersinia massiliensis]OWF74113.1 hypothetical protein B4902_04670 [Yersinia frederiksenii]PHZ23733.1 hypothetical protein CS535_10425 [Yersinia massiliensis]UZM78327.1 hypothetical protein OP862_17670 [Yersinia massiliensis]